ncbi:MAG: hypothetical protein ACREL7_07175 [Longimicrobiales bacterium]
MNIVVIILGIFGFLAVARRVLVALLLAIGTGVENFLAKEATEVSARRGDITAMQESESRRRTARRSRTNAIARLAGWSALLIAPALTPWTALLYATYSPLWLLSGARRA